MLLRKMQTQIQLIQVETEITNLKRVIHGQICFFISNCINRILTQISTKRCIIYLSILTNF